MSEERTFTCPDHGEVLVIGQPNECGACARALEMAPSVESMTADERCAELWALLDRPLTVKYERVWQRVNALVGRGTYTHELARPEALCAEIRGKGQIDPVESLQALAGDKPVFVVGPDGGMEQVQ